MAALGNYPMYAAGSLTLTQLIYSDAASANISIQKELQQVRELDFGALKLDIARNAVAAYMNVMRGRRPGPYPAAAGGSHPHQPRAGRTSSFGGRGPAPQRSTAGIAELATAPRRPARRHRNQ